MIESAKMAWRFADTRVIEWMYAASTFAWGLGMLTGSYKSPSFGPMLYLMQPLGWALLAFIISLCRVIGLSYGVTQLRLCGAFGGGIIWTFTWLTMWMASGYNTGVGVYGVFATFNLGIFVKLCRSHLPPTGGRQVGRC